MDAFYGVMDMILGFCSDFFKGPNFIANMHVLEFVMSCIFAYVHIYPLFTGGETPAE